MSTLSVDVERVTLNGVTSSVRRSCPRPFSQKPRSNVPTAPQSGILSFSVSINTPPGKCSTRRRPSRHPRVSTETRRAPLPNTHSHSPPSLTHPSTERTLAGGQHGALPDVQVPIHRGPARLHRGEKASSTQGEQPGQRRLPRGARDVGRERQHEPVRQCRAVEARVRRRPGVIPRRRG